MGNSTEERVLHLLGSGIGPEQVASACGISVSRVSQLLSDEEFAQAVAELRFENLEKHNRLDNKYDQMEDTLLDSMQNLLPMLTRPLEILRAIQVINSAKRRGISAPEQVTHQQTVVNLVMPKAIVQQFTTNINNQVIQAGAQTLETIQSGSLLKQFKPAAENSIINHNLRATNVTDVTNNSPTLDELKAKNELLKATYQARHSSK
jgi:hypothetical protein